MNPAYKALHQQADRLYYKYMAIVDDKHDPSADSTQHEAKEVVEDIEMSRPPRAIEDRVRRVEQLLEKCRSGQSQMMTPQDAASLIHDYEQFRVMVRRMPNY
jgi:ppGpp synthetase/RelA/SpoT-type nucleotidyltranferase